MIIVLLSLVTILMLIIFTPIAKLILIILMPFSFTPVAILMLIIFLSPTDDVGHIFIFNLRVDVTFGFPNADLIKSSPNHHTDVDHYYSHSPL